MRLNFVTGFSLLLLASIPGVSGVMLNSGHNTIDSVWQVRGNYIAQGEITFGAIPLPDGTLVSYQGNQDESLEQFGIYAHFSTSAAGFYTPSNNLDALLIYTSIDANLTALGSTSIATSFNLSVIGADTAINVYFLPLGARGLPGKLSLSDIPLIDNSVQSKALSPSTTGSRDYRLTFDAWLPGGGFSSISGAVYITFDRQMNAVDTAFLESVTGQSSAVPDGLANIAYVGVFCLLFIAVKRVRLGSVQSENVRF